MAKRPDITTVTSGYTSTQTINDNFTKTRDAFDNTLSRDGSTPNEMNADLDMNSNNVLNADTVSTGNLILDGVPVTAVRAAGRHPYTFDTRADLKTYWDTDPSLSEGELLMVGELVWEVEPTATMISDLQGLKPSGNILSITHFASPDEGYDYAEANGLIVETDEPNRFRGSRLTSGFNNTQNDALVSYAYQVNSSNASRVKYKYVRAADTETSSDPGTGDWATNLARTVLYFNDTDNDGDDRSKELKNLKEGMKVKLTDTSSTTSSVTFILNADAVDNGTYVALPDVQVESTGAGGFPSETSVCNLTSEGSQKDIGFAVHVNVDDPLASGDTTAGFFRAVSNVNADQQNEGVRASAIGNYGSAVLRGPEADGTRVTTGEVWGSYAAAGFNQGNGVDLIGNDFDRAANATSGDPGSGNWGTRSDKTSLRISYTDSDGGDITSDLQAVGSGYKIAFEKTSNTSNRITWDIPAAGTDNGTYIQFDGLSAPDEGGDGTSVSDECEIIIYNGNTATDGKLVGIEIKAANWGGTVYDPLTASGENVGKYNIDFVAGADADNAFQQPVSAMMHNGNDTIGGWLYGGLFRNVRNDFMHFYQPLGSDVRALNLQKESSNLGSWAEEVIVLPDGTGIGWRDSAGTIISPVITRTGTTTSVADNLDADRLYQNGVALELTRAEAVTYLGTTPSHADGTRFYIDNLEYQWETGSTDISDLPNLIPSGEIYPDHFGVNATEGVTDMTSAINGGNTYASSVGRPLVFRRGHTYGYDGGTITSDWVGGGKILCNPGETGNFVTTGAGNLFVDVEFDQNFVGVSGNSCFFINGHDNVSTGDNFVARNAQFNCVRVVDANNIRLRGKAFDSYNKCVLVSAETQDITGLDIDMTVDTTTVGLLNVNGAVSIQGTEGIGWDEDNRSPDDIDYGVLAPKITLRASMLESESWNYAGGAGICLELRRGIFGGHVDATVTGGSLGYSINDCYGTVCQIATTGARNVGIEANGPHNSVIMATCKKSHVTGIAPDQGMQLSKANNVQVLGAFEHRYGSDIWPSPLFINRCNDSHVIASVVADTGGTNSQFARVLRSPNTTLELVAEGVGVDYAVVVDDRDTAVNAPSSGLVLKGCKFPATTNLIHMPGTSMTLDDIRIIGGTVAAPSGDTISNATVTNMQVSLDSDIGDLDATYFSTQPDQIEFMDFREGETSQFRAWGSGTPIGNVSARAGSTWFDTTNGLMYHKSGNTGSSDWQEVLGRTSAGVVEGQIHLASDAATGTAIFGPTSGGTTNSNGRVVRTDSVVNWAGYSAGVLKARTQMNLSTGVTYHDAESNQLFRDYNSGTPVTLATVKTTGLIDTTGGYEVAGTKVVDSQQAAIADSAGGDESAKINAILGALRAHGLIAS